MTDAAMIDGILNSAVSISFKPDPRRAGGVGLGPHNPRLMGERRPNIRSPGIKRRISNAPWNSTLSAMGGFGGTVLVIRGVGGIGGIDYA